MKFIALFFSFCLLGGWFYTSQYWYTCNIKGFCDNIKVTEEFSVAPEIKPEDLFEVVPKKLKIVSDSEDITFETSKSDGESESKEEVTKEIQGQNEIKECDLLVGPIGLGSKNNTQEVKKLESILLKEGFTAVPDGIYKEEDFEAVKQFQIKYREEILDPWGIKLPTGYVFKTTAKKLNEIHCN